MAYDEGLAQRIRERLDDRGDIEERKMFGGLAFLIGGHMVVGVVKSELMVRVGPAAYAAALAEPDAREMDFTGRALRGMVYVSADGIASDERLAEWIARGVAFAASLPAKGSRKATKPRTKATKPRMKSTTARTKATGPGAKPSRRPRTRR